MSNQVIYRQYTAEELHDEGLSQAAGGYLGYAYDSLTGALNEIGEIGEDFADDHENPFTQAITVQQARIHRDLGFTYVRAALNDFHIPEASTATQAFRSADSHFMAARLITGRYIDKIDDFNPLLRRGVEAGDATGELFAEHGATIGLQARMGTAEQVVMGGDYEGVQLAARRYSLAHTILKAGNNGYYRVSNAMNAARHARINGQTVSPWVGRAKNALAWTAVHDQDRLKSATLTNGSRMRFLLSRSKAIDSVVSAP